MSKLVKKFDLIDKCRKNEKDIKVPLQMTAKSNRKRFSIPCSIDYFRFRPGIGWYQYQVIGNRPALLLIGRFQPLQRLLIQMLSGKSPGHQSFQMVYPVVDGCQNFLDIFFASCHSGVTDFLLCDSINLL